MAGPEVKLELAGGLAEEGALGTDAVRVMEAIGRADSGDGVLVLMDLGSAGRSAETALDFLTPEQRESVLLCEAPLVEGAVAAAVAARLGEPLAEVAKEARGGLQGKTAQLGAGGPEAEGPAGTAPPLEEGLTLRLDVRNPLGLHARPAARAQDAGKALPGLPGAPGIAPGPARHFHPVDPEIPTGSSGDPEAEWKSLNGALEQVRAEIRAARDSVAAKAGEYSAAIFDA